MPLMPALILAASVAAAPADVHDTVAAATAFLAQLDAGQYEASWQAVSAAQQKNSSQAEWARRMAELRNRFGAFRDRTLHRVGPAPGRPAGEHLVNVEYRSMFFNRPNAAELLALVKEGGAWKVVAYQIL